MSLSFRPILKLKTFRHKNTAHHGDAEGGVRGQKMAVGQDPPPKLPLMM